MRNRLGTLVFILLLVTLPACRRTQPPRPSFSVQASLAQVTDSYLIPGETAVTPGKRYLVGAPGVVITFHFPEAMDRDATARALAVAPALAREIQWATGDVLQLRVADLPLEQPVQISLGQARASSGGTALPLEFTVVRVEPPGVAAGVEGQPGVAGPGMYRLLSGKKIVRLDFTRPMDRGAVEQMLLPQIDPRCQPTLRWENDQLAYLDLDLLEGVRVEISFLGWPDNRGVPALDARPLVLEGVGTVRLVTGADPQQPSPVTTLLDQFSEGAVSPDGRRVALLERFPAEEAEEVAVWVLDLGNRALQRLGSFTDRGQFAVAWMPDSRHLVVNAGHKLVALDTGGGEPRDILEPAEGTILGMAVAPRSGRIACFLGAASKEGAGVDLVIAGNGSTTIFPAVTRLFAREGFWVPVPCAWSPDETRIAFSDLRSRSEGLLTLIDPDRGGTRLLGGQAEFLAFSPSGHDLAVRNPDGSWDLVSQDDGSRTPLLPAKDGYELAFWSRAGERACFARAGGGFLLWDRKGGNLAATGQGIPLGWVGERLLWITP
ncbi:MAG: hypothetical protein AB1446_03215 [Bacillota bacterium]